MKSFGPVSNNLKHDVELNQNTHKKTDVLIVLVYKPSCPYCKGLFTSTGTVAQAARGRAHYREVPVNDKIISEINKDSRLVIRSVPTIFAILPHKWVKYNGQRTKFAIRNWIEKAKTAMNPAGY